MDNRPYISWLILVYDRKAQKRLPLKRKWYVFSYERASNDEISEVIKICSKENRNYSSMNPPKKGEIQMTCSVEPCTYTHRDILKYRHLFEYTPNLGNGHIDKRKINSFCNVNLEPGTYCEDENEQPITQHEILSMETGRKQLVELGKVNSVLQLGSSSLKSEDEWNQKHSDTIAHFLQVHSQISNSTWANNKLRLSYSGDQLREAKLPSLESTIYVAIYFRQLYAEKDKLLKSACQIYCNFINDILKKTWIENEVDLFKDILNAPPVPHQFENVTNKDLLEAFIYGALIMHGTESVWQKHRRLFKKLMNEHSKEEIAFSVNGCMKLLVGHVSKIAIVIYNDFTAWQRRYEIPKPNVFWHSNLFGNYSEERLDC